MSNVVGSGMDGDKYEELKGMLAKVSRVAREAHTRSEQALKGAIESDRGEGGRKAQVGFPVLKGYMDIQMVAAVFLVHPKTIEKWIKKDGLPCLKVGGVRRFDYDDVTRWASARKEG